MGSANKKHTRRLMLNQQKEQVTIASETGKKNNSRNHNLGLPFKDGGGCG